MTIKIKLGNAPEKPPQATVSLEIKKTLNGNLLINDHEHIDILINPREAKIITLPKPYVDRDTFTYQKDLLYALFKGGITESPMPEGGSYFGVLESTYPKDADVDPLQAALFQISEFLKKSNRAEDILNQYDKDIEDNFADPPDDKTTAYGEIPPYQDTPEGSQQSSTYTYYGNGYRY
jgi:hypothetical protein